MSNESETIKKHPDFNEWLKTEDGLSCNDISNLTEQKFLTNRLFWAFDAGRNCVWDQYLELKQQKQTILDFIHDEQRTCLDDEAYKALENLYDFVESLGKKLKVKI